MERPSSHRSAGFFIDNYCAQHPLDSLASTAAALFDELTKRTAAIAKPLEWQEIKWLGD
jgi:hypothetical protein